jgi:hypothetical protein
MQQSGAIDSGRHATILDFEAIGVCLIPRFVPEVQLPALRTAVDACVSGGPGNRVFRLPGAAGRDLLPLLGDLASWLSGKPARIVRILAFDKTPETNWGVPWHQDRTVAVKRRIEVDGFGPWSVKAGVPHVAPPQALLDSMFSLRLHLDDCGPENGPAEDHPRLPSAGPSACPRRAESWRARSGDDVPCRRWRRSRHEGADRACVRSGKRARPSARAASGLQHCRPATAPRMGFRCRTDRHMTLRGA